MICRKSLLFHYTTLLIICQVIASFLLVPVASATSYNANGLNADDPDNVLLLEEDSYTDEQDVTTEYKEEYSSRDKDYTSSRTSYFYFSDFTADYYLEKDENGISHLTVKETVTAEFPPYKQNKGLVRKIPYTNNNGQNLTLEKLDKSNIIVTRNGHPEPIYSIEKDSEENAFYVSTGTDDYVIGSQTYTFEYTFDKVITDFADFQELFWDTNGTDSYQPFARVKAIVHFDDQTYENIIGSKTSCYVGRYGDDGSQRCHIQSDSSKKTITFSTTNLESQENLSFAINFQPDTFIVPGKPISVIAIFLIILQLFICAITIWCIYRNLKKHQDSIKAFRDIFVKPEYQPLPGISVAEAERISISAKCNTNSVMVATLVELAVTGKIKLHRKEQPDSKKPSWEVEVVDSATLLTHQINILQMLSGEERNAEYFNNRTFTITKNQHGMPNAYESFLGSIDRRVRQANLLKKDSPAFVLPVILPMATIFVSVLIGADLPTFIKPSPELVYSIILGSNLILFLVACIVSAKYQIICGHTVDGIKMSKYFDGLKLYISMAEAERIKVLQSVTGAELTNQGVVKLYEKLLPYAIIFNLESSWLKQLEHYYTESNIQPDWYMGDHIAMSSFASDFNSFNAASSSSLSSSMPSTGGSGSSGSSGGGGGGSSGGGGGGGGFGGR